MELFETAISAQTVIVVVLYVSFGARLSAVLDSLGNVLVIRSCRAHRSLAANLHCEGIAGYSLFGRTVDSDILVSFPRDDTPVVIGRVAISFVASVSYPCIHFASRCVISSCDQHCRSTS